MKIHLYQKRIRGGRRRSPVQHRPRLSWHGRNLDGSRVRSMASIPLLSLSLSLSSIISPSLTRRLSLVASIQPPRTRPIPSSPAPSKSRCETWKHSRVQTPASVRLSQGKPEEALIDLRTSPPPPAQDDTMTMADSPSHALLLLDALPIQTRTAHAKLLL